MNFAPNSFVWLLQALLSTSSNSELLIPFKYSTSKPYKTFRTIEDVLMPLDMFSSWGRVVILSTSKINRFEILKRQSPADLQARSNELLYITIRRELRWL